MKDDEQHMLGHRAFFLFLSRHIKWPIILFLITWGLFYSERWITGYYGVWWDYGVELFSLLSASVLIFIIIVTYLEYRYYTYFFTNEAFVVTNGYVVRNETAALYHQIQNVSISRTVLDRLFGVSSLVVYMAGSEKESAHTKIVLPAVGNKKARIVQKEILVRARKHVPRADESAGTV